MQYKFKAGIALQMSDISFRTGEKIIQTNHLMPVVYQSGTKMRTYKTSTATNQNFLHVMFFHSALKHIGPILFVLMLTNVGDLTKLCKFATKYFTC